MGIMEMMMDMLEGQAQPDPGLTGTPMGFGNPGGWAGPGPMDIDAGGGAPFTGMGGMPQQGGMGGPGEQPETAVSLKERLQQMLYQRGIDFLGGNMDVTGSPMWKSGRQVAENQFQNARENIMSTMPRGGQLFEELANTDRARGQTLTDLTGDVARTEYGMIGGLESGFQNQQMAQMAQDTAMQQMATQQESAEDQAKGGAMGMIGYGLAGKK